jgi:hypothetical protein
MAQANLLVQTVTLLLVVSGIVLARKGILRWHGNIMLVAVFTNGLMLVSHMGPAFVSVLREEVSQPNMVTLLGMAHGVVGASAEFLGVWIVGMWAYVWSETKYCQIRRKWMWRVSIFWLFALGLGYLYYVLHITWG